ncbi:MAG: aconitate hydratase [Candidatus Undinarchaeales archaeon]|jgi:aconitate hydratase|nr:aconitate hydratase [Candidatus Undinarchaeales archaeon]
MGLPLARKILEEHIVEGEYVIGEEIAIKVDRTLTQDATGTMAYLQFEALGIPRVKTELSVSIIDHNTLQNDFRNADDHKYLQSMAAKYGIKLSKAGNGICHQVYLERFAKTGRTLIGSDSHTPTAGGVGMIAIGAGGLDVAVAMGGAPFYMKAPKIMGIKLTGKLSPFVSGKDVILEVLRRIDVKGGVGYVLEYFGPGVKTLDVPSRATITNMGAETGATTSIFPSDEVTREFFKQQGREGEWFPLAADPDAEYDDVMEIDLSSVEPLAACPHSPGKVVPVAELAGMNVDQVAIGSCTNSSYRDLMTVAGMLTGKSVDPMTSLSISPGSRQVLMSLSRNGALADIVEAGARILECTCGPCIGMGQAPSTDGVRVCTFNRNFFGRTGTKSASGYLVSPETAAATAVNGVITDPRTMGTPPVITYPERFPIDETLVLEPSTDPDSIEILRGPNIKPLPRKEPLPATLEGEVLIKLEDNITTDHIMPAGSKILPLRSNVPEISKYVFEQVDPEFHGRALEKNGGFIIGGDNYGQGSSREHAALAPMYLGVKGVVTKSFARIHLANLINFGIIPLEFINPEDYDSIEQGDALSLDVTDLVGELVLRNVTKGKDMPVRHHMSARDIAILKAGGKLPFTAAGGKV